MVDESDNNNNDESEFRRILVAVDTSSHSRAALRAAADLAKKMEANIHGLFVHDETWQQISRLPALRTIDELTGRSSAIEKRALENQIELLKRRLRRQIESISRKHNLSHSWESVQGRVEDAILEASKDVDLITIGRRGSSFPQQKKLGSSAKAIIKTADKPILILKKGLMLGENIMSVYDGSEESKRCLRIALSMAEKNDSKLNILVIGNGPVTDSDKALEEVVAKALVPVEIQLMQKPDTWSFTHAVNRREAGLLVMPKHHPLLKENIETVIYQLQCPLLMMN